MAIKSFKCKDTADLFNRMTVKQWKNIEESARKKLGMVNDAINLNDLRVPKGNHLEKLKGNRAGQHSIKINDQWRVCFVWESKTKTEPAGAKDVEITDYH